MRTGDWNFFFFLKAFLSSNRDGMTDNFSPLNWCLCDSISFIRLKFHKQRARNVNALPCPLTAKLLNPFALGDFAEKRVLKLVELFSGHCRAIKS